MQEERTSKDQPTSPRTCDARLPTRPSEARSKREPRRSKPTHVPTTPSASSLPLPSSPAASPCCSLRLLPGGVRAAPPLLPPPRRRRRALALGRGRLRRDPRARGGRPGRALGAAVLNHHHTTGGGRARARQSATEREADQQNAAARGVGRSRSALRTRTPAAAGGRQPVVVSRLA